jgi:hypothetical protein
VGPVRLGDAEVGQRGLVDTDGDGDGEADGEADGDGVGTTA